MNVIFVTQELLLVANTVVRKSALPDLALAAEYFAQGMRIAAFDQLNGVFDRDIGSGRD